MSSVKSIAMKTPVDITDEEWEFLEKHNFAVIWEDAHYKSNKKFQFVVKNKDNPGLHGCTREETLALYKNVNVEIPDELL